MRACIRYPFWVRHKRIDYPPGALIEVDDPAEYIKQGAELVEQPEAQGAETAETPPAPARRGRKAKGA